MILKEDLLYEKEGDDKEEEDEEEKEKEKEVVENKEEDNGNDNEEHKESSKKMKKKKKKKNKIIKDKIDKTQIDLLGLGDVFSMSNTTTDNKNETIGTNINSTTNNILDIF
jgi:hypothetical protein